MKTTGAKRPLHRQIGCGPVPDDPKRKAASKAVKAAQKQFERDSRAAREARRKAFAKAQKDGLSLREIGELVGLDHSRVGQIIRGD
jgi:DNA-directed RNA polymerase specialized sigma24 family protein